MPPPPGSWNPLEGPGRLLSIQNNREKAELNQMNWCYFIGDYSVTPTVHNDTYPAINPLNVDLSDKNVLIVGASRGIGQAMSVSFAKAGASKIGITARSDLPDTINKMREATPVSAAPKPVFSPLHVNITYDASLYSAAEIVKTKFGRLDILVVVSVALTKGSIIESKPEDWIKNWTVNVMGTYLVVRAFLPLMLEEGDKTIATVSSVGTHIVVHGFSGYEMSKLGVLRLSKFIAAEHGKEGVIAYSIHPGNVPTDMVGGIEDVEPEMRHDESAKL
jgi:NAD(P)-dependent dehydrogenase (short-subunit alcohol dehydrogenase family)